jgi:hypothetical protein
LYFTPRSRPSLANECRNCLDLIALADGKPVDYEVKPLDYTGVFSVLKVRFLTGSAGTLFVRLPDAHDYGADDYGYLIDRHWSPTEASFCGMGRERSRWSCADPLADLYTFAVRSNAIGFEVAVGPPNRPMGKASALPTDQKLRWRTSRGSAAGLGYIFNGDRNRVSPLAEFARVGVGHEPCVGLNIDDGTVLDSGFQIRLTALYPDGTIGDISGMPQEVGPELPRDPGLSNLIPSDGLAAFDLSAAFDPEQVSSERPRQHHIAVFFASVLSIFLGLAMVRR